MQVKLRNVFHYDQRYDLFSNTYKTQQHKMEHYSSQFLAKSIIDCSYYSVMNKLLLATTVAVLASVMALGAIAMPAMATGPANPPEPPTTPSPEDPCDGLAEALAQAVANGDAASVAAITAAMETAGC